jgi:hypothetical protein
MAKIKPYHPFIKDPFTGMIYPNQELFRKEGFIGCFNSAGETDIDNLPASEVARIFPSGVPEAAKIDREAKGTATVLEGAPGIEMEVGVVVSNLERLYAEGKITREYLLSLTGGVPQEKFVNLQEDLEKLAKTIESQPKQEEKVEEPKKAPAKKGTTKKTATKKEDADLEGFDI